MGAPRFMEAKAPDRVETALSGAFLIVGGPAARCAHCTGGGSPEKEVKHMVKINGKEEAGAAGRTVLEYLKEAGYRPERVVVERNLEILPKETLDQVILEDGDSVEILHFVGGG